MTKPYITEAQEEKFIALHNTFVQEAAVQGLSVFETCDAVAYLVAIFALGHGKTFKESLPVFEGLLSRAQYHFGTQGLVAIADGADPDRPLNLGPKINPAPDVLNNFLKPKG